MTMVTQIGILRGVALEKGKSDLVTILGKNQPYIFIARVMFFSSNHRIFHYDMWLGTRRAVIRDAVIPDAVLDTSQANE
jgi:hypothetical protein